MERGERLKTNLPRAGAQKGAGAGPALADSPRHLHDGGDPPPQAEEVSWRRRHGREEVKLGTRTGGPCPRRRQTSRVSSGTRSTFSQEKPPSLSGWRPKWP